MLEWEWEWESRVAAGNSATGATSMYYTFMMQTLNYIKMLTFKYL